MSFLRNGFFCSASYYESGLSQRVDESQIKDGDLHTLATRLDGQKYEAATFAVRTIDVIHKAGMAAVKFSFLNKDMESLFNANVVFSGGICSNLPGVVVVDVATEETYRVKQAYVRDVFTENLTEFLDTTKQLSATG